MDETLKKQLEITACKVRLGILEGVFNAKSGHPGGSLSIADLLTYLYFAKMNVYLISRKSLREIDSCFQRVTQHLHSMQLLQKKAFFQRRS